MDNTISFDKYSRIGTIVCFCVAFSACANHKVEHLAKSDILDLSEIDFVSVARSDSSSTFDESTLRRESTLQVMQYSLSKGMIPMLVSEVVESSSDGLEGYVKQHIRLLGWADAQIRLKTQSTSDIGGLKHSDLSPKVSNEGDIYNDLNSISKTINSTSSNDTLEILSNSEDVTLNNCEEMKEEHETKLGQAIGDMCKGHSLSFDYYQSLEEFGCKTSPKLQKLAKTGINKYCERKID